MLFITNIFLSTKQEKGNENLFLGLNRFPSRIGSMLLTSLVFGVIERENRIET